MRPANSCAGTEQVPTLRVSSKPKKNFVKKNASSAGSQTRYRKQLSFRIPPARRFTPIKRRSIIRALPLKTSYLRASDKESFIQTIWRDFATFGSSLWHADFRLRLSNEHCVRTGNTVGS